MDWSTVWVTIWTAANSPVGIAAIASVVLWLLGKAYTTKPAWQAYEGTIIAAVKFAEKQIPDDVENAGMKRLDVAMKWVLHVYEVVEGQRPSSAMVANLTQGVQITHAQLEVDGIL